MQDLDFRFRMPRYQNFTKVARQILEAHGRFVEIAGNHQIMVTAVVPRDWNGPLPAGEILFASEILTDARSKRIAMRVPVAELGALMAGVRGGPARMGP